MNRLGFLGGSDAAAALGLSPWKTPVELWLEKTGKKPSEIPDNIPMAVGRALEDFVAKQYGKA